MQGGAMDQYQYEYEDDGVVFDGVTPDSASYAAANSPDAEARYWERIQNLPPDQAGFVDQGDYGGGYGDYGGAGWGYGGYGVSRWGHLEDIAEEGESAGLSGLSGSQHMPGSSGSYQNNFRKRSSSMEQPPWGRGDKNNGSLHRPSPSPEPRGSPPRSLSPKRQPSPPNNNYNPPPHPSHPIQRQPSPPANGAHDPRHDPRHDPHHELADINQRREPQLPAPNDHELPSMSHQSHASAEHSYAADPSAYHNADQGLEGMDSVEYGAVQAHAQQYNSVVMGEHAYLPDSVEMHLDQQGSWDGSMERHSNDEYGNYNNAAVKKNRPRSSPVRTAKTQPIRRPSSGGAEHTDVKYSVARDKHSVSGSSFMSQKSSASQPISGRSSAKSEGSPRGLSARVRCGSPTRSSTKHVVKRPPFRP